MPVADSTEASAVHIRSCTLWRPGDLPEITGPDTPAEPDAVRWFDVTGATEPESVFAKLDRVCRGLRLEMLEDLVSPDPEPKGETYEHGRIRLASSFSVDAWSLEPKAKERGLAQRSGVLVFRPVELLASEDWLLTCWHPTKTFSGADEVPDFNAHGKPESAEDVREAVADRWRESGGRTAGDLGVLVINELAMGYGHAVWALYGWLQDWELSLYVEDELDNPDELRRLWGEMAVLRDWLSALNLPGLRQDMRKAWLPVTRHEPVIEVDNRVDKALESLAGLANTLRTGFSVLGVQQAEQDRRSRERLQHRIELIAAVFLVPTLIVGFYGANTWVPGEQEQWGFWVMVAVLLLLSGTTVTFLLLWQRAQRVEPMRRAEELRRRHEKLLRDSSDAAG